MAGARKGMPCSPECPRLPGTPPAPQNAPSSPECPSSPEGPMLPSCIPTCPHCRPAVTSEQQRRLPCPRRVPHVHSPACGATRVTSFKQAWRGRCLAFVHGHLCDTCEPHICLQQQAIIPVDEEINAPGHFPFGLPRCSSEC